MRKLLSVILAIMVIALTVVPVAAAADSFVPSIEMKETPGIIIQTDSKGNNVAAIIYDKDGHEIIGVPEDAIIITPLSGADEASEAIKEALKAAQKNINDVTNLGELTDEIMEFLKKNYPELDIDDLVVSQLFDIRLNDEYAAYLTDDAYFTVKLDLSESFLLFLMMQNNLWSVGKDYKLDGNVLTLSLKKPTQIALVKSNYSPDGITTDADKNNAATTSPQTGSYTNVLLISLGVLFAAGAVLLMIMFVKNKKASE